ncbi:MAG: TPM domain-containing protein [Lachnospiraceae bacterium]|nr:TPM domain-containing protein [Lachnospiraceae bacterium]
MRRKAAFFLLTVFAVFMLSGFTGTFTEGSTNYVYDEAHLFSQAKIDELNEYITSVRDKAKSDFLVVTTNEPEYDDEIEAAEAIAHAWRDAGNGYGKDHQVIVFYIDIKNRNARLMEYNDREKWRLSDSEIDEINSYILNDMVNGNYGTAAGKAIQGAAECAKPGFFERIWGWITVGIAGGGAASGIALGTHNAKTTTPVRYYMRDQRVYTGRREDQFTHTTTVVQPKQTNPPTSGHSGGGSSGGSISSSGAGHSSGSHGGSIHF